MATNVISCRVDSALLAPLLQRQARRHKTEVGTLAALYLREKALEEEYPGIGFRDSAAGREAYVQGRRVAVWEVEDVQKETRSQAKTAEHFGWPQALVRCALAFARDFAAEVAAQREAETK
jgi:hypothetical protein